jgi:hypothetical protein
MVNLHGLLEESPEQDAPVTLQLEKVHPREGVAVTEIEVPATSGQ